MLTVDDLLAEENVRLALESFRSKRDGSGPDGMRISELPRYWKANHHLIEEQVRSSCYHYGVARKYEVIMPTGKRRLISSIDAVDRLMDRLLHQLLEPYYEQFFLPHSFAFQTGKGPPDAAACARDYVAGGLTYLCEVDLKDYFDWIPHEALLGILGQSVEDEALLDLLRECVCRSFSQAGKVIVRRRGVLQGCCVSPLFANLYLHSLDLLLDAEEWPWLRFADNLYVYAGTEEEALARYERLCTVLETDYHLHVNTKKSGVYEALKRRVLGYDLRRTKDGDVEVVRHEYRQRNSYPDWHRSALVETRAGGEFHLVDDGILTRDDFSLLFENADCKRPIPIEVTEQLNVYGNVMVTPVALQALNSHNIRLAYFDKHGDLMGTYVPTEHACLSETFLAQCQLYTDEARRLDAARRMEIAGLHNMRSNLRYYHRKTGSVELEDGASELSALIQKANEATSVGALLMLEAQARKCYYACFNHILQSPGFTFTVRSRRPPKDQVNALISFGNTLLYSKFLQLIWRTSLDPRVGVVHATNGRHYSLNLDLADIFKPVVVDRVIFSLVNRRMLGADEHFHAEGDGVLLTSAGKRLFIDSFQKKLASCHEEDTEGAAISYAQLLAQEVDGFRSFVVNGTEYRPYKCS